MESTTNEQAHEITGLTESERMELLLFLTIVRNNTGSTTPVEDFICSMVAHHTHTPMTPGVIKFEVEQLTHNWTGTIENAAFLSAQYPKLFQQQLPPGMTLSDERQSSLE
jgi:hypothetical protein